MGPGFIRGIFVGAGASILGLSALSLSVPLPSSPRARTEAPVGVAGAVAAPESAEVADPGPDADLVELPPTAPVAVEDEQPEPAVVSTDVTEPAAVPEVEAEAKTLDAPVESEAPATVTVDTVADDPVAPTPAATPEQPEDEVSLSISTEPALPIVAEPTEQAAFDTAPAAVPETETAPDVAPVTDPSVTADKGDDIATPAPAQVADLTDGAAPGALPDVDAATGDLTQPADAVEGVSVATRTDEPVATPGLGDAPTSADAETELAVSTEPADPLPAVAAPDAEQEAAALDVEQEAAPEAEPEAPRRTALPQILPEGAEPPVDNDSETEAVSLPGAGSGTPPIVTYAEAFDNPDGKPLMSIVLIDGPDSVAAEALADFPYPLTFAVDPKDPRALEKMKAHRAVGFEVVLLADLPAAATPADAEVSMSVWMDRLSQVVAVLEGTGTGFQGNRSLSDHVTDIVLQTGHGLITQDKGLNTVQKLAARSGIPSAVVFRDFDGAGQSPTVMRRFLDQAAFRAGQQGAVVMLGRLSPDTVSALLLWGLQDRADRVALAPISAILTHTEE